MEIKQNKLYLGGIACDELAKKYGTPLYVYEEDTIRQRINDLKKNIAYPKLRIHYACKANTNLAIMRILREEGAFIDAVSPGEVYAALKAGYKAEQILFTGNSVTDEEMKELIAKKVMINIDSLDQLERYGKLNPGSKFSVRINPDVGAGHHDHCITGGPDSKFGIYYNEADKIKKAASQHKLNLVGLHMHIGSGILDTKTFIKAMNMLLKVAKEFDSLEFVDFGGGIGVPYRPEQKALNMKEFGKDIGLLFKEFAEEYKKEISKDGKELIMAIEPGRYLVCESGFLLAQVNTLKETSKHKFVGIDTGFGHLVRPMMYDSYHPIINASNVEGQKENISLAGNICESGDLFAKNRDITKVKHGDIIAITHAGAYGFSMSSPYNMRPRPAEILVKAGKATIIRQRETYDDLLRGQ
ncbi:MAG: diaminopimelate decarboxylase [Nanoarchaeota archaeon]|nr:diaminopimelate decarboxylase [Nanoarchaeota archaeon]